MRALILIAVIAWLIVTGLPGGKLLRRGRHPLLAAGGIVTSFAAGMLFLLITGGVLDFFGNAFHESSIWLKATIVLFSVNLVLGHAGILVLMDGESRFHAAIRWSALLCVGAAACVIGYAGVTDQFSGDPGFLWLPAALLGLGIIGTLVAWLGTGPAPNAEE